MPRACAQRRPRAVHVLGAGGQPRARAPLGPQHRGARRGPLPVWRVSASPSLASSPERSRCCCCAGTPPTLCRALSAHPRMRSTSRPRRAASTTCTSPSSSRRLCPPFAVCLLTTRCPCTQREQHGVDEGARRRVVDAPHDRRHHPDAGPHRQLHGPVPIVRGKGQGHLAHVQLCVGIPAPPFAPRALSSHLLSATRARRQCRERQPELRQRVAAEGRRPRRMGLRRL